MSYLTHLECSRCGERFAADQPQTVCARDGGPLFARYDLSRVRQSLRREELSERGATRSRSMWRYREVMPCDDPVTLGEGWTPLLPARRLGARLGARNLWIKDEGMNPTASFKARGLSCAVSMMRQFGIRETAIPTAGNAGSALAAYAAVSGIAAHIYAPADVPKSNLAEYRFYGAHITLVNGLIGDCGRQVQEAVRERGWFDVSTMKEPYRVEGKKTMAYEAVEQLGWRVPDTIFYPTGGGVGLIGMWKAFDEMEALGWIDSKRPRMVAVQTTGCAPVVRAFESGAQRMETWSHAATVAAGLRVPKPYADDLILNILRQSHGTAIAVTDDAVRQAVVDLASLEGIFAAPEGAAAIAAAGDLYRSGWLKADELVVLYNTGGGLKYLEELQAT